MQVATGKVVLLPDLLGVQGVAFDQPTVVLAQALGGMEDIPDGVVAVLTRSSTDVLSHVAIRARTQGVLLAGCSDEEEWRHLVELEVREQKYERVCCLFVYACEMWVGGLVGMCAWRAQHCSVCIWGLQWCHCSSCMKHSSLQRCVVQCGPLLSTQNWCALCCALLCDASVSINLAGPADEPVSRKLG